MVKLGKQQIAVYASQDALELILNDSARDIKVFHGYGSSFPIPLERKFSEMDQVENYVNRVLKLNTIQNVYGKLSPVAVKEIPTNENGEYKDRGRYSNGVIHLSPHGGGISNHMRETYILHELAHHLVNPYGRHGGQFVEAFLDLISAAMDEQLAYLFKILLMEAGAKVNV